MTYQVNVTGVIRDPLNVPIANVPIKIVTETGYGDTLSTAETTYYTDEHGMYDFYLVEATHTIYVMFTDTFEELGVSVINGSVPTPSTINELLFFSTPIQPPIVEDIYTNIYECIGRLEEDINTCTTQLSEQVVQGDVGVCQAMTVYTNDCLAACSAELTTAIQAGDAGVVTQMQAYTDALGTDIACCTTLLSSGISELCSTVTTLDTETGCSLAQLQTNLESGDAAVQQTMLTYTDTCTGEVEASLTTLITTCTAEVQEILEASDTLAAYEVHATLDDVTASISVIAEQQCIDDQCYVDSCVIMQANKVILWNGCKDANKGEVYPFIVVDNVTYIDAAMVNYLCGTCIEGSCIYGTVVSGSEIRSTTFNSVCNPAGGIAVGFCIDGASGSAEFNDLLARGELQLTGGCLNVNDKFIVTPEGVATITSASSGSRLVLSDDRLEVYDGSTLRVRLGRL